MSRFKLNSTNQNGFAALVVAIVFIIVLSLITIGFAQLMRSNETAALNKQLSTQAYDAAESGVNAAAAAINKGYNLHKTNCGTTGIPTGQSWSSYLDDNTVGGSNSPTNASYPCLLINPTPTNLTYNPLSITNPDVIEMQGIDPTTSQPQVINSVKITWSDANDNNPFITTGDCNNTPFYPAANAALGSNWNFMGMVRAELVPINSVGRDALYANSYTAYLCPSSQTNQQSIAYNNSSSGNTGTHSGILMDGGCVSISGQPNQCSATISNLNSLGTDTMFLVIKSIYFPTSVTVTVTGGTPDHSVDIGDAQYLVDSTGKAENVLRRIQVRIPATNNYYYPPDGSTICKQLQLVPSTAQPNSTITNSSSSSQCAIPTGP